MKKVETCALGPKESEEISSVRDALACVGYKHHGAGVFTKPFTVGWRFWAGYAVGGEFRHLSVGLMSSRFSDVYWSSVSVFNPGGEIGNRRAFKRVSYAPVVFIADCTRFVADSSGTTPNNGGDNKVDRANVADWLCNAEPMLSRSANYNECLLNLERYSAGLPMFAYSKLILLFLANKVEEARNFGQELKTTFRDPARTEKMEDAFVEAVALAATR